MKQIIKNHNGKEYMVLKKKGMYTLLKELRNEFDTYVVAWNLKIFDRVNVEYIWRQGYYFHNIESAIELFIEKIKEGLD